MSTEQKPPFAALPLKDGESMMLHELEFRLGQYFRRGASWGDLCFTVSVRERKDRLWLSIEPKARK